MTKAMTDFEYVVDSMTRFTKPHFQRVLWAFMNRLTEKEFNTIMTMHATLHYDRGIADAEELRERMEHEA